MSNNNENNENNELNNAVITCDSTANIVNVLSEESKENQLGGWTMSNSKIDGGNPYILSKDEKEVHLRVVQNNVLSTANVLPADHAKDSEQANAIIDEFIEDLSQNQRIRVL